MLTDVSTAVQALQVASKIEDVQHIAHKAFTGYGFEGYICVTVPLNAADDRLFILYSGWPHTWMEHYIKQGYRRYDPTLKHVANTDVPFLSLDAPSDLDDALTRKIRKEKIAHGLEFELAIPVQAENRLRGGVFLRGTEHTARNANRHELQLIAMTLFSVAYAFSKAGVNPLTRREIEMLEWAAKGKTTDEIAKILGLTPRTVNTHFENSMRKLGTENRLHTVVSAMRLKLIR